MSGALIGNARVWIGLGASAGLLALFLFTVDLDHLVDAMAGASYIYVVPAIALYMVSVVFRTIRWQVLLRHMRHIGVVRLYPVVVVGYMANNLLPMRLGELVRGYYLGEREGVSKTAALATILVERVADALTVLLLIAVIAPFVPLAGVVEGFGEKSGIYWPLLVIGLSLPFVVAFAGMVLLAAYPQRSMSFAKALVRHLPRRLEGTVLKLMDLVLYGLTPLRSPRKLAVVLLLSVPVWLFEAGLFYLIGFSFDLHHIYESQTDMALALILAALVANLGASIPATPGGIGLFELITREFLILLPLATVDRAVAGGYTALVHASVLLPMIVLGQLFLWTEHISLGSLAGGSLAGRSQTSTEAAREATVAPTAHVESKEEE